MTMPLRLTDPDIDALIAEPKEVVAGSRTAPRFRTANRHARAEIELVSVSGSSFRIMLRRAELNHLDFSVILAYEWAEAGRLFLLRRYNGLAHEHQNVLEREAPFYDYHIHQATERYQRSGFKEEHYAVPTRRYVDLLGAYECCAGDCGLGSESIQPDLFGPGGP